MTAPLHDYDGIAERRIIYDELAARRDQLPETELTVTEEETAEAIANSLLQENNLSADRSYYTFHDVQRMARIATEAGMKYVLSKSEDRLQGDQ